MSSCDRSKLTPLEARGVAVADRQRNVSACKDGYSSCDPSTLTASETREVAVAGHERYVSDCKARRMSCNAATSSPLEARESPPPSTRTTSTTVATGGWL